MSMNKIREAKAGEIIDNKFKLGQKVVFDNHYAVVEAIFLPLASKTEEKIAYSLSFIDPSMRKKNPPAVKESAIFSTMKEYKQNIIDEEVKLYKELHKKYGKSE